ncbi:hypothetical protein TNCV_1733701 [Trichonephila clavipes]|nr:hypothetical protein TNCV_1733701 [Trichonephila clavipes]
MLTLLGIKISPKAHGFVVKRENIRIERSEIRASNASKEVRTAHLKERTLENESFEVEEAIRRLLVMDHVILNHGQVTWMTPELAPPTQNTIPHQREGRSFEHLICDSTIWLDSTPIWRESTLGWSEASHLSSPSTNLTRGVVDRRLFRVPPCRAGTIHLQTSMSSPGFEPLYLQHSSQHR